MVGSAFSRCSKSFLHSINFVECLLYHVLMSQRIHKITVTTAWLTSWMPGSSQASSVGQHQFSSVQLLSHVWLFATPWTTACQASLSITNSQSPPKPMSTESEDSLPHSGCHCHPVTSSSVIPFSCLQYFPASGSFLMSHFLVSCSRSIRVSPSTSVLPMNTQDWSPLGWTGWISLQSTGLSRVFSNTTVQKHQFFGTQLSL